MNRGESGSGSYWGGFLCHNGLSTEIFSGHRSRYKLDITIRRGM
jgi:hypothetical protein